MSEAHRLREIVSAREVDARLEALCAELARDYADAAPLFVVIAEGACRFADRLQAGLLPRGLKPQIVVVRARRTRGTELQDVELFGFPEGTFRSRRVLVLDDIADEGRTMEAVLAKVREQSPAETRVAVLVSKLSRRCVELDLDYVGFELEDGWVVGYGMDLDEAYRELDSLCVAEFQRQGLSEVSG